MPALRHLDLTGGFVGDEGAQGLSRALSCLLDLRCLSVARCSLGGGVVKVAAALRNARWLERLDVSPKKTGDASALCLVAHLPVMLSLRELKIGSNAISGSVVRAIRAVAVGVVDSYS
jgi:hypothetical protein